MPKRQKAPAAGCSASVAARAPEAVRPEASCWWYATIARNYEIIDVPINEWSRRRALGALARIDGDIVAGFLPAAPRKDGCKGCEYRIVCGPYEEERARAKSQAELSGLKELRGWK